MAGDQVSVFLDPLCTLLVTAQIATGPTLNFSTLVPGYGNTTYYMLANFASGLTSAWRAGFNLHASATAVGFPLGVISNSMSGPSSVIVDSSGNNYVVDSGNNRVIKFSAAGSFQFQFGGVGTAAGQFNSPRGIGLRCEREYFSDRHFELAGATF